MALIKCGECGGDISKKADKCPKCGAPTKKKTRLFTWVIVGFLGLLIIGAMSSDPLSTSKSSAVVSSGNSTTLITPESAWNIISETDSVSGKEEKHAIVFSTNKIEMDFPYHGGSTGKIIIRKHPRYGKDVIFSVDKGQLLCDISAGCQVSVRFDNKPAIRVHAIEPADHSTDTLFLRGYDRLIKQIKTSKKMLVEATFFQNGARVYEFDIEGLKFD